MERIIKELQQWVDYLECEDNIAREDVPELRILLMETLAEIS